MVPIYICEDDSQQRALLEQYITNYCLIENLDMQVKLSTENPQAVLTCIQEQPQQAIYFFDIDLNHPIYTGLQLASEIRQYDAEGYLIFITTHAELTHLTFQLKVNALDFIIKDGSDTIQQRVVECLSVIQQRMKQTAKTQDTAYFSYQSGDKTHYVPVADLLFFEAGEKHKLILYTDKERREFTGSLQAVEQQLGSGFYRSHRSTLVQLSKIAEIDSKNGQIVLVNQQMCALSVRKAGKLKKMLKNPENL